MDARHYKPMQPRPVSPESWALLERIVYAPEKSWALQKWPGTHIWDPHPHGNTRKVPESCHQMTIHIELKSEPDNDFSDQKNQKTGEKGIVKIFEIMKTAWPWSLRKRYCMDCPELCFTNPVGAVATENQSVCKNPAAMTSFIEGPFIETIQWAGHCSWDARAILAHRDTESLPSQSLHSSEETDNRK